MTHEITRVRHELRRRKLTLARVEQLSPGMRRLHFVSSDLDGFPSVGFDDHIKMFVPGEVAPAPGERGTMRDFTPRRFDTAAGTIAIDYALHDAGPAIDWARDAAVGDVLEIGGPRGSAIIPDDFDWYWLIGDMTSLPAIGRRLEELRADVPVTSIVLVDSAQDAQAIDTAAQWTPRWIVRERPDADLLTEAIGGLTLPPGEGFVWIAAEAGAARAARHAVEALGQPARWIKAAGYWQQGDPAVHVRIDE
ncbi:siderophore-interacting protein [Sphingomonas sp.]|jgi:NADPH-dependent ferric siderophore reductase|uniref:siderophore-interacting protein n=1 Tax=Sphingomonas sp. TaxID=28214 RepID=UPI002D7FA53A|nr:siderophore-interacting protein [Sphingomonas sp.]HEU0044489.1 siderophore-interacting protein [Sphingomonas sp.]